MKKLLIFIDESGIHKQIGHSVTVVVYIEIVEREVFEKQINVLEEKTVFKEGVIQ